MIRKNTKKSLMIAGVQIAIFASLLYGVGGVQAQYREPSQSPIGGNIDRPVHIGSEFQRKTGELMTGSPGNSRAITIERGGTIFSAVGNSSDSQAQPTNYEPVLVGRAIGSNGTMLYYNPAGYFYLQDDLGNVSMVARSNGSTSGVGIGTVDPDMAADLTIGSKGIKLGGSYGTQWPTWGSYQQMPGTYLEDGGRIASCPTGHVLQGITLFRDSGQNDRYVGALHCVELKGLYRSPSSGTPPTWPEPEPCIPTPTLPCPE